MTDKRKRLIQDILNTGEEIYGRITPTMPRDWLLPDLTVAQLRVMMIIHSDGPSRMSHIASAAGTALSTATGIIDALVKKGFVLREADPQDRRLVICRLAPEGQDLTNSLWSTGRFQIEKLLKALTTDQLEKAAEVATFLLDGTSGKGTGYWRAVKKERL